MSDDEKSGGLVKQVYSDAAGPAVREAGDVVRRVVRLALAPLRGTLWTAERAEELLAQRVDAWLSRRGVPEEQIQTPAPQVQAGVVLGVMLTGADSTLAELFAALLASSMDKRAARTAHPAFADVIRQMTGEDARVFASLPMPDPYYLLHQGSPARPHTENSRVDDENGAWSALGNASGVADLFEVREAFANLERVGLVRREDRYEQLISGRGPLAESFLLVTNFGQRFARVCLPPDAARAGAPRNNGTPQ